MFLTLTKTVGHHAQNSVILSEAKNLCICFCRCLSSVFIREDPRQNLSYRAKATRLETPTGLFTRKLVLR